ncbi:hypothetical protein [Streptomyces sp. NPDC003077]|uniref:hypothetical protein n=1 Tax=Streptomyces sp. NPDC003077 TaxID=3154443 RepID=UPI0033AF60F3
MDEYAGRVLAERYRLPMPPSDEYDLVETRAFDTYSGQEVLVRQVPLPEVVDAEVLDAGSGPGAPGGGAPGAEFRGGAAGGTGIGRGARAYGRAGGGAGAAGGARATGGARAAGVADRSPRDPVVRRALEAATAAARLPDHPLLDQVYDVFAQDGSLWVVSELIAARPLAALLAERSLTPHRAAEIAADILTALRALHAHGWTHRNITVHTVMVCADGRAVLTGLAVGAAQEALCGYDPVPVGSRSPGGESASAEGGPEAGGAGGPVPGGTGVTGAADEAGEGGVAVGRAPGERAGAGSPYGPSERQGGDPEQDARKARAGAIAAYRAGARAAARASVEAGGGRGSRTGGGPASRTEGAPSASGPGAPGGARPGAAAGETVGQRAPDAAADGSEAVGPGRAQDGTDAAVARPRSRAEADGQRFSPYRDHIDAGRGGTGERAGSTGVVADGGAGGLAGESDGHAGFGFGSDAGAGERVGKPGDHAGGGQGPKAHPAGAGVPRTTPGSAAHGGMTAGNLAHGSAAPGGVAHSSTAPGSTAYGNPAPGGTAHGGTATGNPAHGNPAPGSAVYGGSLPGPLPRPGGGKVPGAIPVPRSTPPSGNSPSLTKNAPPAGRPATPPPGRPAAPAPAAYGRPTAALAAERARQVRINVIGAVTERWAPEQAEPVHAHWQLAPPVGPATDLWAIGALLFRSVQGHAPFPEESAAELVQLVCSRAPAAAEDCGALRPVVESLMRQDPTDRPDFEELRGWLRSLIRTAPEPDLGARLVTVPALGRNADPRRLPIVRRRGELVRKGRHKKGRRRKNGPSRQQAAPPHLVPPHPVPAASARPLPPPYETHEHGGAAPGPRPEATHEHGGVAPNPRPEATRPPVAPERPAGAPPRAGAADRPGGGVGGAAQDGFSRPAPHEGVGDRGAPHGPDAHHGHEAHPAPDARRGPEAYSDPDPATYGDPDTHPENASSRTAAFRTAMLRKRPGDQRPRPGTATRRPKPPKTRKPSKRDREPTTALAEAVRPERPARRAQRGTRSRERNARHLGRLLVGLVMLLLVAAVAYAVLFMPKAGSDAAGSDPAASESSGAEAAVRDIPARVGATQPDADRGSPDEGEGSGASSRRPSSGARQPQGTTPADLADGFAVRKDPKGFQVAVREGWERRGENERGQIRYLGGDIELLIVPGRDTTARYGADPMAYQQDKEAELAPYRDSSWSSSSGLRRIDVGATAMAEGTFNWQDGSGRQVYVRNLAMIHKGRYHLVQVIGPDNDRREVDRIYDQATGTYRPGA